MLELRDSIDLAHPSQPVWDLLADPATWPHWNPKVVSVEREAEGELRTGEFLWATYRVGSRQRRLRVEAREVEPLRRLCLVSTLETAASKGVGTESWEIEPIPAGGVRVTQRVDLSATDIPLPIRVLSWALHRFGRPSGPTVLEELKRTLEGGDLGSNRSG